MLTNRLDRRVLEPYVVAHERQFSTKQMHDGAIRPGYLGPLTSTPDRHPVEYQEKAVERGLSLFPLLAELQLLRVWSGLYDSTPDYQAILGDVDGLSGYFQAVGFSGHGFMMGPVVGLVLAELIAGQTPSIDVSPLHFRRFARNELIPEPNVI
jgi:sarcosine oxidase subunit beta